VSEKNRKRQLKDDVDRRHKSPVIEADCFEAITTAQIVEFVSGQVARRGLAPKTANRYREILTRLFNWAVEQKGIRIPGDRNPASKVERYRESAPNIPSSFTSDWRWVMAKYPQQIRSLRTSMQS
jgi:hypothetical protein